jgi:hypothetical protein
MSITNTAVFGLCGTPEIAKAAVERLLTRGFISSTISFLLQGDENTRETALEKDNRAPQGTATVGGIPRGTLGLIAGLILFAIPGVGSLIAAGPFMATVAGAGVEGIAGGMVGALVGAGIPEFEAKGYEGAVKDGATLLSVHCDTPDQANEAKTALEETGARDIVLTDATT